MKRKHRTGLVQKKRKRDPFECSICKTKLCHSFEGFKSSAPIKEMYTSSYGLLPKNYSEDDRLFYFFSNNLPISEKSYLRKSFIFASGEKVSSMLKNQQYKLISVLPSTVCQKSLNMQIYDYIFERL